MSVPLVVHEVCFELMMPVACVSESHHVARVRFVAFIGGVRKRIVRKVRVSSA